MTRYRAFGVVVASGVHLRGVPRTAARSPACSFELGVRAAAGSTGARRRSLRLPDGRVWATVSREPAGYTVDVARQAAFFVSADGRRVVGVPAPGVGTAAVGRLFLAQALPLALSRQGETLLHASAVVTPAGAIAFVGPAGRGKSTLAASFARDGFPILSDDGLRLGERRGRLVAFPSYPETRLWPDVLAALRLARGAAVQDVKRRVALGHARWRFGDRPVRLRRLYLLEPTARGGAPAAAIAPVPGGERMVALVRQTFRLELDEPRCLAEEFARIGRLASAVSVRRLRFVRDLARLPEVRAAVLADVAG